MKIEQKRWSEANGWEPGLSSGLAERAQLVLLFGSTPILKEEKCVDEIKMVYPRVHLLGCSTAGEICGTQVTDDSLIATAVHFEHTRLFGARIKINNADSSFSAGEHLAKSLDEQGLVHVLVLSDGLKPRIKGKITPRS